MAPISILTLVTVLAYPRFLQLRGVRHIPPGRLSEALRWQALPSGMADQLPSNDTVCRIELDRDWISNNLSYRLSGNNPI